MIRKFADTAKNYFLLITCFGLVLSSCLSEDDTPPEIDLDSFQLLGYNTVTESFDIDLAEGGNVTVPGSFVLQSNITDDVLIDRLEINIIPLENTEEQEGIVSIYPWNISGDTVLELSVKGTAVNVFREVEVPSFVQTGVYQFSMTIFDREGNSNASDDFNVNFSIVNNSPRITILNPAEELETYLTGDVLNVKGEVNSETALSNVTLSLGAGNFFESISYTPTENTFQIDTFFTLTDTIGIGTRILRTRATDIEENSGALDIRVKIE